MDQQQLAKANNLMRTTNQAQQVIDGVPNALSLTFFVKSPGVRTPHGGSVRGQITLQASDAEFAQIVSLAKAAAARQVPDQQTKLDAVAKAMAAS